MPLGPAANPPSRRVQPKIGGWIAGGAGALAVAFAAVVTTGPAQPPTTGTEASVGVDAPAAPDVVAAEAAGTPAPTPAPPAPPEVTEQPETRTVQLDVTMVPDGSGGSTAEAVPPTTPEPVGPVAAIGCPAEPALVGTSAHATFGYSVTPGSAPIVHYAIDYGDGGSFANQTVEGIFSHTYALGGSYEIRLEVTDAQGLTDVASCSWTFSLVDSLTEPIR